MSNKHVKIVAIGMVLFLPLLLSSCFINCINGNGNVVSDSRTPERAFEGIAVAGSFDAIVTPYSKDSIHIEAESNLMEYILTEVEGDRLVLKTPNNTCIDPRKPVIVHIFAKNIRQLSISGSGSILTDPFKTDQLSLSIGGSGSIKATFEAEKVEANISGSGNINLAGSAQQANYRIAGSGKIQAYDLSSTECVAGISGSGNIYLTAAEKLKASISGSGSVYYKGSPSTDINISGSGGVHTQKE